MKDETKQYFTKRLWPIVVSLSSASVMLLAFFIPSVQDQWDRFQAREIIQSYVKLGDEFMQEKKFTMAEQAYAKAYLLSEEKRLDIEVKRLGAEINLVYQDLEWGSKPPEGLEEVDFQFLLHFRKGEENVHERAFILTSYGVYLASVDRRQEAEQVVREAISINPNAALGHLILGNLHDDAHRKEEAIAEYKEAIQLEPNNAMAHYNLGLILLEVGKRGDAESEFTRSIELDSTDHDAREQLELLRQEKEKH